MSQRPTSQSRPGSSLGSSSASSSSAALTPTQQRLLARVKEVQMFAALESQAQGFADELDSLSKQTDLLCSGSQGQALLKRKLCDALKSSRTAIGAALQNWHAVFRTTSMALSALAERGSTTTESAPGSKSHRTTTEFPEQLVRIPLQKESRQEGKQQQPGSDAPV